MNLALYRRQHGVDEVPVWRQVFVSTLRWDSMLMVSDTHGVVLRFHSEVPSRRKLLLEFVKLQLPVVERLAGHVDADVHILGEKVFVPSFRTIVAMIRSASKATLSKYLSGQAHEAGLISRFGSE